jgi:hypothetical protein
MVYSQARCIPPRDVSSDERRVFQLPGSRARCSGLITTFMGSDHFLSTFECLNGLDHFPLPLVRLLIHAF